MCEAVRGQAVRRSDGQAVEGGKSGTREVIARGGLGSHCEGRSR